MQGVYAENVLIDIDGITLRGVGGVGTVRITPATGSAVTITNCTSASVKTFAASKDASALVTNGKTAAPVKTELIDLYIEGAELAAPKIAIVGHPTRPPLGIAPHGITLSNCLIGHKDSNAGRAILAYYAEFVRVRSNCEFWAGTDVFNCLGFYAENSSVQNFLLDYDPTAAPAPKGFEFGLVGGNAVFTGPTVEIRGITPNEKIQPTLNSTFYDLILREGATLNMVGGSTNDVTVEGGANWTGGGVYIGGNLNLIAGTGKAQLNGGFIGALNDPSDRLVRKFTD